MAEAYDAFHEYGFFWAAGYSAGSEDSMHFEIAEQTLNEWVAAGKPDFEDPNALENWPTCTDELWLPTHRTPGGVSTREEVFAIQLLLKHAGQNAGVDGQFGSGTVDAVEAFQSSKGITVTGYMTPETWTALHASATTGDNGDHVKAYRSLLSKIPTYTDISDTDSAFDSAFAERVLDFKRRFVLGNNDEESPTVDVKTFQSLVMTCIADGAGSYSGPGSGILPFLTSSPLLTFSFFMAVFLITAGILGIWKHKEAARWLLNVDEKMEARKKRKKKKRGRSRGSTNKGRSTSKMASGGAINELAFTDSSGLMTQASSLERKQSGGSKRKKSSASNTSGGKKRKASKSSGGSHKSKSSKRSKGSKASKSKRRRSSGASGGSIKSNGDEPDSALY